MNRFVRNLLGSAVLTLAGWFVVLYLKFRTDRSRIRRKVIRGSRLLKTERGEIEVAVRGTGSPVLLLHGAGGGYDQGLLLGKGLEQAFQLIAVSRFGYLRSPLPKDATLDAQAALYRSLLDHLGHEKVIVLAGSAGGPSALQFAHDYPQRCSALLLISAITMPIGADKNRPHNRVIHLIQRSDFVYWLVAKFFQAQFLALIGIPPDVYKGFTPEERELAQELLDTMHPMSLRYRGTMHEFEMRPLASASLSEIRTPALIFHARDDLLVSCQHAEFAHENIPLSKLVMFESGGHGLVSRNSQVRQEVDTFLDSVLRP